jgi:hypothetical protein
LTRHAPGGMLRILAAQAEIRRPEGTQNKTVGIV